MFKTSCWTDVSVVLHTVYSVIVSSLSPVDLFLMYSVVKRLGGYRKVKQPPPALLYLFNFLFGLY